MEKWEIRRHLRWGSEHVGWADTEALATSFANRDIQAHDNLGRIKLVDRRRSILYYDVYPELT